MFRMGQDQSKGVELEDKVVESQYGVTRTMKVPQICINVVLTREEFEMFRCSNFRELLRYNIVTICWISQGQFPPAPSYSGRFQPWSTCGSTSAVPISVGCTESSNTIDSVCNIK